MLRKLLIAGAILLVAVIGFRAVRHSDFGGYVCSQMRKAYQEARNQIPTQIELDRLEYDIAQMDRDIQKLADPLASLDFDIRHLKGEITQTAAKLDAGKTRLTAWTNDLEKKNGHVIFEGKQVSDHQLRRMVSHEFKVCKSLEAQLKAKRNVLAAKQKQYDAIYDQANKLAAAKKEFQVDLDNLRAEQELLKVSRLESTVPVYDGTRADSIKDRLQNIQKRLEQEKAKLRILKLPPFAVEPTAPPQEPAPEVNVQEIRSFLQGNTAHQKTVETVENND